MLVTQFQASDARRFMPCFDEPAFRAIFDLTVIAPDNRVVISNMPEDRSESVGGGKKRVHFAPTPSMPSYLLFLGVGDFERVTTNAGGVEINVWTKRGDSAKGRFALEAAAQVLPYYNEYFGVDYPLPKLDIIAAPGNSFGFAAMENWGAILFFEEYSLVDPNLTSESERQFVYTTVAHEIAHMWFGDLVTMQWWDDLWLNEGFATWMENKASDHFHPDWNLWLQAQGAQEDALQLDARPTTHPIVVEINNVDQANELFDDITYDKGNAVVRMFEVFAGEEAFRQGVRDHIQAHAYGNATSSELWSAIERASGRPLTQIADDFTRQPGVPLISVGETQCAGGQQNVRLSQREFTTSPMTREPLTWHVPVTLAPLNGRDVVQAMTGDDRMASAQVRGCGPFVVNPDRTGYYRTLYPRPMFERLARDFARVRSADQLGLLYDARALGRAGQAPASDFFMLAARTPRNADPLVWSLIADQIGAIDSLYGDDPRREAFRARARDLLNPVFRRVGWSPRAGESDNDSLLRASLIQALSAIEDPRFEAEALRRYQANDIDGSIRADVLNAVGAAATPQVFAQLLGQARAAEDTLEKNVYYEALAEARDPALAQRVLNDIAFDADVRNAEGARLVNIVASGHPEMALDFNDTHGEQMRARVDSFSYLAYPPRLAASSNDPAMLTRIRAYIDSLPENSRRASEAAYAGLVERLSTRERRLNEICAWAQ